jgi:hypothetical protein
MRPVLDDGVRGGQPVEARHPDVEKADIGPVRERGRQRCRAVGRRGQQGKAGPAGGKLGRQRGGEQWFVLSDQGREVLLWVHGGDAKDAGKVMLTQVPPEGTRSKNRYWKSGFYYIALGAQVPIVMAYMDYERKRSGLGPVFVPTGDVDADMATIKAFYAPFKGRNAAQFHAGE